MTSVVLEMDNNDSVERAPSIFRVEMPLKPTVYTVLHIDVSVSLLVDLWVLGQMYTEGTAVIL